MASEPQGSKVCEANRPRRTAVRKNLEGARQEKLRALKASRSAYRGVLKRVTGRIEELMADPTNKEIIKVEKMSLDKTFRNYTKCCDDFKDVLTPDEEVRYREVVLEYDGVSKTKAEFGQRISEWIATAEEDEETEQLQAMHKQSNLTTSRLNVHNRKLFCQIKLKTPWNRHVG